MNILFTGASSYIAYWVIKELKEAGHDVTAILHKEPGEYEGVKKERVDLVSKLCKLISPVSFGDEKFLEILENGKFEVLCLHAAQATDPRSPEFDWLGALEGNIKNIDKVFKIFKEKGGKNVIVTGSLYEADESAGTPPLDAFNRYGLSKTLTWETFRYFAKENGLDIGKIICPITFGIYEDPKFVGYLAKSWLTGQTPTVKTPRYVRDNINVTLLAKAYRKYLEDFCRTGLPAKFYPSGYIGSQGDIAKMIAGELGKRWKIETPLELFDQTEFPETKIKINTDYLDKVKLGWDEEKEWDKLADYYLHAYNLDNK